VNESFCSITTHQPRQFSIQHYLRAAELILQIFSDIKPELAAEALHFIVFRQDLGAEPRELSALPQGRSRCGHGLPGRQSSAGSPS